MSFWDTFRIPDRPGPKYLALFDALAEAIRTRRLGPGRRLPSHRFLARKLGLSIGTVSRAYAEALELRLITAEVGSGTFVSHRPPPGFQVAPGRRFAAAKLDLYQNFPVEVAEVEHRAWAEALLSLPRDLNLAAFSRASWSETSARQRAAGAAWISRTGFDARPEQVLDCPGTMAALSAILAATAEPGSLVFTAALSHPMIRALCQQRGVRLKPLPMDEGGIDPGAFESACREESPRLLYCTPTIHSPTTHTMDDARRQAIADVALRHGVFLLEDEHAAFLLERPHLPIAAYAPESTFFVGDVWMALSLGLRTTWIHAPERMLEPFSRAVATTAGITAPLIAEVAALWVESDTADRLIAARRAELGPRQALLTELLGRRRLHSHPFAHHAWLELPEPWSPDRFVLRAEQLGIAISGPEFSVGHAPPPPAVRICVGNAPDRESLRWALEQLDRLIDDSS